jgi:hypothetical protein
MYLTQKTAHEQIQVIQLVVYKYIIEYITSSLEFLPI